MGHRTGGGSWQEGGAFIQPEGGLDWSNYDQLAVDIFLPEGADGFLSQIFAKTGARRQSQLVHLLHAGVPELGGS